MKFVYVETEGVTFPDGRVRLALRCPCGEALEVDAERPWASCPACSAEVHPDPGEVLPLGCG